jgi:hypothetical protein
MIRSTCVDVPHVAPSFLVGLRRSERPLFCKALTSAIAIEMRLQALRKKHVIFSHRAEGAFNGKWREWSKAECILESGIRHMDVGKLILLSRHDQIGIQKHIPFEWHIHIPIDIRSLGHTAG